MSDEAITQLWDQQPEEPGRWYARFDRYRLMGPRRTMLGAVHAEEAEKGKEKQSVSPPGAWSEAAEKWRWKERAEAWDRHERDRLHKERAQEIREARSHQTKYGRLIQKRALEQLTERDFSELSVPVLVKMLTVGLDLELSSLTELEIEELIHRMDELNIEIDNKSKYLKRGIPA